MRKWNVNLSNDAGGSLPVADMTGATLSERIGVHEVGNPAGVRGADSSERSFDKSDDVSVNVTKPGIVESGGLLGCLMPRRNVVNDNPSGSFGEGNLENPLVDAREDDSSSSSNRDYASGDVSRDGNNRAGTSGGGGLISRLGNFLEQIYISASNGRVTNEMRNETETRRRQDARRECTPQLLRVTCSSDSDPPSPSSDLRPSKHYIRKQFGDAQNETGETMSPEGSEQFSSLRVVTMPRTGASERISTALDRFCGGWRTCIEIDFNCALEIKTDQFSVG